MNPGLSILRDTGANAIQHILALEATEIVHEFVEYGQIVHHTHRRLAALPGQCAFQNQSTVFSCISHLTNMRMMSTIAAMNCTSLRSAVGRTKITQTALGLLIIRLPFSRRTLRVG